MSKEISCSACFSKLSGPPIECELCHDPDTCYCSKQCRSALGWSQHQAECNVVHSKELVAVPYAWQNMTADWHEQQHKFPAYIVKDKLSPTSVQQTIVPSITKPASVANPAASVASATAEQKTKAHSFYVEVNGVPLKRLQAPDAMISQYSGNAAAQHLASVRLPRTEGRTYWVASTAASAAVLKTNAVNEFRLVRGTGESEDVRVVRAHLVGNPVAHFEQQVGSRLGTGLRRFLKEQYKFKGLGSSVGGAAATGGATYYAVNPETRDTVTFTINKELQLVDLEFYAPKTQEPVSLQQETYETSFDDQDPTSVQALIMALTRIEGCAVENGTQNIRVLEEHHRRLSNPSANIEGDIAHLIRVRTAVSESLSLLQEQQELIGKPLSEAEWTQRLINASEARMMSILKSWAERLRQLIADRDAWEDEERMRSDLTAGRSLGFRKKVAGWRAKATTRSIENLKAEIGTFKRAVDALYSGSNAIRQAVLNKASDIAYNLQNETFSDFADVENMTVRKFKMKGSRTLSTEAELRYFQEASRKPVGNPYSSRAAAPIGLWVQSPDDPNQVIYFSGKARSDWDKSFLDKDGNERYEAGDTATKADVLQTYRDLHPNKLTSEDQLIYKLDDTGKEYTKRYETDASLFVQGYTPEEMKTLTNNFGKGTAPASEDTSKGVGGGGKEPDKGAGGGSKVGFDEYDDPVVGQGGGGGGGAGGGGAAAPAPKASSSWSKGYADSNPPDHPAGRRNYWYGQGGGDDDDFTIEELIACSFPENVMLNENFDWRTTPAVLSDYPEYVDAIRSQAFIGVKKSSEEAANDNEIKETEKLLKKLRTKRGKFRSSRRKDARANRQEKSAGRLIKRAEKNRGGAQSDRTKAMNDAIFVGDEDVDFTLEELIACSFPREVMLNEHFDWRRTPSEFSDYPEHVEELRGQALIGARDAYESELMEKMREMKKNNDPQWRQKAQQLKEYRANLRQDRLAVAKEKFAEKAGKIIPGKRETFQLKEKRAMAEQLRLRKERFDMMKRDKDDSGYHHGDSWFDGDCYTSSEEEDEHRHYY